MKKISQATAQATFGFPDEGFGQLGDDGVMRQFEVYRDVDGEVMAILELDESDDGYFVHYASLDL